MNTANDKISPVLEKNLYAASMLFLTNEKCMLGRSIMIYNFFQLSNEHTRQQCMAAMLIGLFIKNASNLIHIQHIYVIYSTETDIFSSGHVFWIVHTAW